MSIPRVVMETQWGSCLLTAPVCMASFFHWWFCFSLLPAAGAAGPQHSCSRSQVTVGCRALYTRTERKAAGCFHLSTQTLKNGTRRHNIESPSYSFLLGMPTLSHPSCQALVLASGMQTNGMRASREGNGMERGLKSEALLGVM